MKRLAGRGSPDPAPGQNPACRGCAEWTSRREALGQMSAAVVAAMVGTIVRGDAVEAVPISAATGTQTGAAERSYPLPTADGVTIDREAQIIVVRFQGHVYAFNLACPHENTALRWRQRDVRFQCPRHESQYRPDGTFMKGRATRNMDRFPVSRAGDTLVVDLSRLLRSDQQPQEWEAAAVSV